MPSVVRTTLFMKPEVPSALTGHRLARAECEQAHSSTWSVDGCSGMKFSFTELTHERLSSICTGY